MTFHFSEIFLAEGKEEREKKKREKKICLCILQESKSEIRSLKILTPSKIRTRARRLQRGKGNFLQTACRQMFTHLKLAKRQLEIKKSKEKKKLAN